MKTFKPNLIPNTPKDGSFDITKAVEKNGGMQNYIVTLKKDGIRMQFIDKKVLSRALEPMRSKTIIEKYSKFAEIFDELKISVDGEFYSHGMKFNAIFRFFSKSSVLTDEYKAQLLKELTKNPAKFKKDYDGLDIEFLTTWHKSLKVHIFDGTVLDRPDLVGYRERMQEIKRRISLARIPDFNDLFEYSIFYRGLDISVLNYVYQTALNNGYEGLVLTHVDHQYKFGRNSLKEGTILKMKDDAIEFDGVVLDVEEATSVKDGVEKTTNELGRSVTSKKKGDRVNSGIAKGFLVEYTDCHGVVLGTFTVSLKGFDHEERKAMFLNKTDFIGRHFTYTGMNAVKDFPRHAYFKNWRDAK